MQQVPLKFFLGAKAHLDGSKAQEVTVIAIVIRAAGAQYEVSWFSNGNYNWLVVEEWRLKLAAEPAQPSIKQV